MAIQSLQSGFAHGLLKGVYLVSFYNLDPWRLDPHRMLQTVASS